MTSSQTGLHGRVALVTGANSGLGKVVATELARLGATVAMVARDPGRGTAAQNEIRASSGSQAVHLFCADLSSQEAVRTLASRVLAQFDRLDLLINNAGTAFRERRLSVDGIEMALAVNHLAPFLLTSLLLERLAASAPARIINVGTRIDTAMDLDDLQWEQRRYRMMAAYGQSKLGLIHFTYELARRLQGTGVTVNCVFPGVFRSNLGGTDGAQGPVMRLAIRLLGWAVPPPRKAAERVLYLATSPEAAALNCRYVAARGQVISSPDQTNDPDMNRRVWEVSARLTGLAESPR